MKAPAAASFLFLLVSPWFSEPTCAFTPRAFFGGAGPRRQASSRTSFSSCDSLLRRWASEEAGGGGDDFSFADVHRELNRRRVEDAMSAAAAHASSPVVDDGEAFMEEQMASGRSFGVRVCVF